MKHVILISAIGAILLASDLLADAPSPYKLDNGLTVILRPVPTAAEVAVVVLFDLGGDHDPAGKSGRAHLLEHVYCTAATGDTAARDFMQIQKRYTTGYNQQTGADYTVFAGVVKPDQLAEELQDAAARMGDLRLTESDFEREVPRVLAELENMYGGIPSLAGINHVRMRLHPIPGGGRYGGNPEHIRTISLEELRQLWNKHYKPNNAILVLAGQFDVDETRERIEEHFGPIPAGSKPPPRLDKPEGKTGTTHRVTVEPIMPGANRLAAVGYGAPPPESKDYAQFLIVVSRLWSHAQKNIQPTQLQPVYYPPLDDPSTIVLQAALPPGEDADDVLDELDQRLQSALTPKLKPQDKQQAINAMAILGTMDASDTMWSQNAYGLAFGAGRQRQLKIDGGKLKDALQRATDADMQRLARSVFAPEKRLAVIVKTQHLAESGREP